MTRGLDGALLAVPNVTAHPSAAGVPVTVLLYNDPLLCSFNAGIKGLTGSHLWVFSPVYSTGGPPANVSDL